MPLPQDPTLWSPPCPGRIIIVCALRCEASPLIDAFKLRPANLDGWPQAFIGEDGIALIVSGPGAFAAATAVGFARAALVGKGHPGSSCPSPSALSNNSPAKAGKSKRSDSLPQLPGNSACYTGFVNIGVAGHSLRCRGELFCAHKVLGPSRSSSPPSNNRINKPNSNAANPSAKVQQPSVQRGSAPLFDPEYPVWTRKQSVPSDCLQSVDQPQLDYHHPTLSSVGYDMEGYAFMRAAKQFADAEDIGLYKVVLDSPRDPIPAKPAKIITKLIATHVDTLCEEIRYRKQLAAQRCDRQSPPPILHSLLSRLRPTVSQNHRLRTLVLRYRALCPDTPLPEHVLECKNATDGIRALEAELLALHDPYGTLDSWELNSSSKRDEIP